ncbi:unnamed protein product [Phytophthora lilii]|uniref:Unnamed protein product n=1 Tax=Phytophthora lilii TaxID=2077276 RepID=A0A9W6UCI1_9STRA|nr:unnamed protein product [Phytophthora lilii]
MVDSRRPIVYHYPGRNVQMDIVVAGNPSFGVLSHDAYDAAVNARFALFVEAIVTLLKFNPASMLGLKFVMMVGENKAKDSIIGVSLAFIDHLWNFKHIAIFAEVMPDGLEANLVADVINTRLREVYA